MKKFLLGLMLFVSLSISAQQVGARFGVTSVSGNESNNFAVDGVFSAGQFSRIHADVSFGDGFGIDALYDFIFRPVSDTPLNWYVGVGPSLFIGDDFWLGASGEIGLEFEFDSVPIVLGLDYRPTFWFFDVTSMRWDGFGFNVRYNFGNN